MLCLVLFGSFDLCFSLPSFFSLRLSWTTTTCIEKGWMISYILLFLCYFSGPELNKTKEAKRGLSILVITLLRGRCIVLVAIGITL